MDAVRRRDLQGFMTRLAHGDRAAFHPLYEITWPLVRGFARKMLRNGPDAEDAAQQALLNIFERASEFESDRDALRWVLGVVAYECRTVRRRAGRRREDALGTGTEPVDRAPSPEQEVVEKDLEDSAWQALQTLPPADIETLLQGAGERERDELRPATFRKRLERARKRLREAWSLRHGSY